MKKRVISHLKDDIKTFKKEASEDKKLIKELSFKKKPKVKKRSSKKPKDKSYKFKKVMHEFKEHSLRSGSKKGPLVSNPKQAIAIAFSEAKRSKKVHKRKKKK